MTSGVASANQKPESVIGVAFHSEEEYDLLGNCVEAEIQCKFDHLCFSVFCLDVFIWLCDSVSVIVL